MMYLNLIIIAYLTIILEIKSQTLNGDHICPQEQKYTVTVEKNYPKNVTIREYVWCMSVPPRCSKYKKVLKNEYKIEKEEKTKIVDKCCHGYVEDQMGEHCIPLCAKCVHGLCIEPEKCECHAGFTGANCNQTACLNGSECDGTVPVPCDTQTGNCQCTGTNCNTIPVNSTNTTSKKCSSFNKKCISKTKKVNKNELASELNITEVVTSSQSQQRFSSKEEIIHPQMIIINKLKPNDMEELKHNSAVKKNLDGFGKTDRFLDETWLMDDIRIDHNNSRILMISIIVTVTLTCAFILIAFLSIIIAKYNIRRSLIRQKSTDAVDNNNRNHTSNQQIIQRSTFHAPLPDIPPFQSPDFTLISADTNPSCTLYYNSAYYNNLPVSTELNYDYPPSTGSYRAANSEPLYDEIPGLRRPIVHTLTDTNENN